MTIANIVSAVYFDLHGTDLGGRPSRNDHYLYSLKSIMKMKDCHFFIYTNDVNKLEQFLQTHVVNTAYNIILYDLYNTEYREKINAIKDCEATRRSDRCIELQYSKFTWLNNHLEDTDYSFWFDAGLCYSGIIPDKYLNINLDSYYEHYYGSEIFSNNFIYNLIKNTKNKFTVCAKNNTDYYWDGTIPHKYYQSYNTNYHIIGGFFGGDTNITKIICEKFKYLTNELITSETYLYTEEQILTCLFYNYRDFFNPQYFDIWWHENNTRGALESQEEADSLLSKAKSFYKILENFI